MPIRSLYSLPLMLLLTACGLFAPKDHFESRPITFAELKNWVNDDHLAALETFKKSCPIQARKSSTSAKESDIQISGDIWRSLCNDAELVLTPPEAKAFFEQRFVPYRIANNGKEQGLFTGYYEPVLYGAYKKAGDFKYPLYAAPAELKNNKPYYSHAQIAAGALKNRGLEIVWVDDPVMLFFMQIQGSGRVRLPDGKELRINYADGNGHPYVSLGKIVQDEGLLAPDQINFFTIRKWLYDHPAQAMELMQRNPSYVFFKISDKPDGPYGSVGAPLTPQRSLAIDSRYIPYGLPLYLETELPAPTGAMPFTRIMIAQDTGGAIKSPVRGDIFFGPGSEAEYLAGNMKGRGVYSLLVPKEIISQMH